MLQRNRLACNAWCIASAYCTADLVLYRTMGVAGACSAGLFLAWPAGSAGKSGTDNSAFQHPAFGDSGIDCSGGGTDDCARYCFYQFPGQRLLLFASMLPLIVPTTVFGMGIHLLLIRVGLSDTVPGVILVHVICALPYTVSIMTDSTRAIGKKLEEQARVLGAGSLRAFWSVSMPALMPAIFSALAMAYITSFSQYFLTLLIGGGNVRTFTVIMVPYLQNGDRTLAAGYTTLFLLITVLVFLVFRKIVQRFYPCPEQNRE